MLDQQPNPYTLLKISGDDATSFLQGQLTNDVLQLDGCWQYTGLCNPKGRLLAILRLWQHRARFYALLPSDLAQIVVDRLRMYILRSKVQIEIIEQARTGAFEGIEQLGSADPQLASEHVQMQQVLLARTDEDGAHNFALVAGHGILYVHSAPDSLQKPDTTVMDEWHDRCIDAGVAEITQSTTELFIPQMVNLDLIGGISFKKGCYTGQEIVARLHYLGNLKQRMLLCTLSGELKQAVAAGEKVFSDADLGKNSGTIVSISEDGSRALAVLRVAFLEQPHFLQNGQSLDVVQLQPYQVLTSS